MKLDLIQLWILDGLLDKPQHTWALRQHMLEATDGQLKPPNSSLYKVVLRLVNSGLIELERTEKGRGAVPRKIYRINERGQSAFAENIRLYPKPHGK